MHSFKKRYYESGGLTDLSRLGFWYWRHLKYWQIFRLKHYFKYDEDGNPRSFITIKDMEETVLRYEIAQQILDNITAN